jgi:GH15 family glucan-1,4-alpha-glucosidase
MTVTTLTVGDLVETSARVIAHGQAPSGAYIASPTFSQYGYGWLRDGAYCALAMDAVGHDGSAAAFHRWVAGVLESQRDRVGAIVRRLEEGGAVPTGEMLPTRYTLDGAVERDAGEAWPNFQLDGYGTWLFALHSHLAGRDAGELRGAVRLAAEYLAATWRLPCFDYWEESGDRRHTSTLASIAAGLRAAARLLDDPSLDEVADDVLGDLFARCVHDGAFTKGPDDLRVDASLVSLATPFGLVPADDPVVAATIARVRVELASPSGGIRRYLGDTYYGGNPWLLLTAWLGWHDRVTGHDEGRRHARDWVLGHAGPDGSLPEQLTGEAQAPHYVQPWVDRWGPVADPLLWSHAKFLLLESEATPAVWR